MRSNSIGPFKSCDKKICTHLPSLNLVLFGVEPPNAPNMLTKSTNISAALFTDSLIHFGTHMTNKVVRKATLFPKATGADRGTLEIRQVNEQHFCEPPDWLCHNLLSAPALLLGVYSYQVSHEPESGNTRIASALVMRPPLSRHPACILHATIRWARKLMVVCKFSERKLISLWSTQGKSRSH